MRAIVTGGAGFVGSHLVDKLIELGHQVGVIDNLVTGHKRNVTPEAWLWEMDLRAWDSNVTSNIDVIYHLAALPRIQPSFRNPVETYEANSTGTIAALELARHYKCRLIYAGTSSVYHDVYSNPYTYTKWLGEQHCAMYNKLYGVPVSIARFFNVYGPRMVEEGPYATLLGIFCKAKREGTPLTITGDGTQRRDFTHVFDIVNGLIAMSDKDWNADIFNLGRGHNFSVNEVAEMFGPAEIVYLPKRPGEAEKTLADLSFTKLHLNWEPKVDLEDYIKTAKLIDLVCA